MEQPIQEELRFHSDPGLSSDLQGSLSNGNFGFLISKIGNNCDTSLAGTVKVNIINPFKIPNSFKGLFIKLLLRETSAPAEER